VQTYIPWNFHEPVPRVYDFATERNVTAFIQTAHDLELLVLLRPGPYVCAEWDFGGFPAWLLDPDVTGARALAPRAHPRPVSRVILQAPACSASCARAMRRIYASWMRGGTCCCREWRP